MYKSLIEGYEPREKRNGNFVKGRLRYVLVFVFIFCFLPACVHIPIHRCGGCVRCATGCVAGSRAQDCMRSAAAAMAATAPTTTTTLQMATGRGWTNKSPTCFDILDALRVHEHTERTALKNDLRQRLVAGEGRVHTLIPFGRRLLSVFFFRSFFLRFQVSVAESAFMQARVTTTFLGINILAYSN